MTFFIEYASENSVQIFLASHSEIKPKEKCQSFKIPINSDFLHNMSGASTR